MNLETMQKEIEKYILLVYSLIYLVCIISSIVGGWSPVVSVLMMAGFAFILVSAIKQIGGYEKRVFRTVITTHALLLLMALYTTDMLTYTVLFILVVVLSGLYGIERLMLIPMISEPIAFVMILLHRYRMNNLPQEGLLGYVFTIVMVFYIDYVLYLWLRNRRKAQNALEEGMLLQKRLKKSKHDFLTAIKQEMRMPIESVCKLSKKLQKEEDSIYLRNNMGFIHVAGTTLLEYMDDVFDYSLLQSEQLELKEEPYTFSHMIQTLSDICQYMRESKDIDIIFDIDATIPDHLVGDEDRLCRAIGNLVMSAVKYTKKGGVLLSITYTKEQGAANLMITVTDTGSGMSAEELQAVQLSFKQLGQSCLVDETELGLGLMMSHIYIMKMNGDFHIQSTQGEGTTASVMISQKIVDSTPRVSDFHESVLCYFDNIHLNNSRINNAYEILFAHLTKQLGARFTYCNSMTEFQQYLREEEFANVLISSREYTSHMGYFDYIAERHHLVVASEFYDREQLNKKNIYVVGIPFDIATLVKLFQTKQTEIPEKTTVAEEKKTTVSVPANGLVVGRLNTELGCTYCGGEEVYLSILREHAQRGNKAWARLQALYDDGNWEDYGVEAHGIKSSMLTIGAEELSAKAKQLEFAAKKSDVDYIRANHLDLLAEFQSVISELRQYFSLPWDMIDETAEVAGEKRDLTREQADEILAKVEDASFMLDREQMLGCVELLQTHSYHGKSLQSLCDEYVRKVNMEDYLSAFELLKKTFDNM